jgi:hypothetical protein
MGVDVCRYRLIPTTNNGVKIGGLSAALSAYQSMFSILFDALSSGPRKTTRISSETMEKTAFDYGYSFAGSVGVAMTIPNARLVGVETTFDEAFRIISELAKASTTAEVLKHARRIGPAPIRSFYRWAEDHLKSKMSADIVWQRGEETKARMLVQDAEFEAIVRVIRETSEEERHDITTTGSLIGIDESRHSFHFKADSGEDYLGTFVCIIDAANPVSIPSRFRANITRVKTIQYAVEEEKDRYEMTDLSPLNPSSLSSIPSLQPESTAP